MAHGKQHCFGAVVTQHSLLCIKLKFVLSLALILACTYVANSALQPDTKGVEVKSPVGSFATK